MDKEEIVCPLCKKIFKDYPSNHRKFCSKECSDKNAKGRRNSLNTEFKKGLIPFNKGKPHMTDEKHPMWKGDKVKYTGLHMWVRRKLKYLDSCQICNSKNYLECANFSGKYKRDLNDWLILCNSDHQKFDKRKGKYSGEELIAFEDNAVEMFKQGRIRSPLHLAGGDEEQIIKIFNLINKEDIVYSTYRSHYHSLLHGISKEWLNDWILKNHSIHVMHDNPRLISSAIVGGTLPLAVGSALAIKLKGEKKRVWCMIGDMTATTGIFWECYNYAINEDLPIVFVISDNGLSTDTPTKEVWGMKETDKHWFEEKPLPKIIYYKYKRSRPHYGIGQWVDFDDENKLKQEKGF